MHSVQRHFGKYMKRSADEKQVSVLLRDFEDAEQLLTRIIDSCKAWRESWISILTHQARIFSEFQTLHEPLIGAGPDYQGHVAVETPEKTMARTARMNVECEELRRDLSEDVSQVDSRMIKPCQEAKDSLHAMKKTVKKREDRKLDFERYQSRVDSATKKTKPSERDKIALTKAQSDLSTATEAYNTADDHLRQYLPPMLTAVFSLLPHILAAQIQIQNTLLGHYYTSIHTYCSQEGFPNPAPPMDEVIRTWSDTFLPLQSEIESLPMLASGKAVRMPMQLEKENGHANGYRRPSGFAQRTQSVSPARALPPSPDYEVQPKTSAAPSPSGNPLLSSQSETAVLSPSPTLSAYTTPASAPLSTYAPAGPNMDYFSRNRQPSTTSTHSTLPSSLTSAIAKKKPPPPPPPRMNSQQHFVVVTALYDFGGQGEGDLVFREGDKIKVLKSTESKDDWWQGELRGMKGPFPANYCE